MIAFPRKRNKDFKKNVYSSTSGIGALAGIVILSFGVITLLETLKQSFLVLHRCKNHPLWKEAGKEGRSTRYYHSDCFIYRRSLLLYLGKYNWR